jgi:hypothetical protein
MAGNGFTGVAGVIRQNLNAESSNKRPHKERKPRCNRRKKNRKSLAAWVR